MNDSSPVNSNIMSIEDKVRTFYDAGSGFYSQLFGEHIHDGYYLTGRETREKAQENLIKLLVEKAGIRPGSQVLDVGCGLGGSSVWLAKNLGAKTTGITISPVQLEMARKLAEDRKVESKFLLMDAQQMEFSQSFDIIWLVAALTHFPDQRGFIVRSGKFLNHRGKIAFFDWTLDEGVTNKASDTGILQVEEGMILSGLHSGNDYLNWLMESGYRITYSEDITARTIQTWDIGANFLRSPKVMKLAFQMTPEKAKEAYRFMRGRDAIKTAMHDGKVRSIAIVAEKI